MKNLLESMINNKLSIILFGLAGSGKGTQSDIMKKNFNLIHIAPGDLLRERIKNGTLDDSVAKAIKKGNLVPSDQVVKIIFDEINRHNNNSFNGILFDGFPRNIEQQDAFEKGIKKGESIDIAILLEVKKEDLIKRLSARVYCDNCNSIYSSKKDNGETGTENMTCSVCGGHNFTKRLDDSDEEAIERRFKIYEEETSLVIDLYKKKGILHVIDGTSDISSIAHKIQGIIEKHLK